MNITEYKILSEELEKIVDRKEFKEYFSLCSYDRFCLRATNHWRKVEGKEEINVPEEDTRYYGVKKLIQEEESIQDNNNKV